jgi:hypothetical protein
MVCEGGRVNLRRHETGRTVFVETGIELPGSSPKSQAPTVTRPPNHLGSGPSSAAGSISNSGCVVLRWFDPTRPPCV